MSTECIASKLEFQGLDWPLHEPGAGREGALTR